MTKKLNYDEEKIIASLRAYQIEKTVKANLISYFREIVFICEAAEEAGLSASFIYAMAMNLVMQHLTCPPPGAENETATENEEPDENTEDGEK